METEQIKGLRRPVEALVVEASKTLILPRFRQLGEDEIKTKTSAADLVTIADIEAEAWLTPRLMEVLPESKVIGEEAVSRGEISTDLLKDHDPVWIIDPVDGTYSFANGSEEFCCMVALIQNRTVLAAWIYFPTEDRFFWAGKGCGAFANEFQLHIENVEEVGAVTGRFWKREHLAPQKTDIQKQLAPIKNTRCAGMDYRRVATGAYAFVAFATLKPWDHAPGTLLVSEAGGQVLLNGGGYDPSIEIGTLVSGGHPGRTALAAKLLA